MHVQAVLFDGFDPLDVLGPLEILYAGGIATNGGITVELVSAEGARDVPSGLDLVTLRATNRLDPERDGLILVPGAAGATEQGDPEDDSIPSRIARTQRTDVTLPMVVLVNQYSASASEIVSGALKNHDRAVIIGTPTYGKGSAQSVVSFGTAGGLRLTTARWFTPVGRSIARRLPDDEDEGPAPVKRERFRTNGGRTVYGGGGITPDIIAGDTITPLAGIRAKVGAQTKVGYAKGCDVKDDSTAGFAEAVALAHDVSKAYGVKVNPVKADPVTFAEGDKLVLVAEDEHRRLARHARDTAVDELVGDQIPDNRYAARGKRVEERQEARFTIHGGVRPSFGGYV